MSFLRSLSKVDIDPVWLMRIFTVIPAVLILLAGAGALWMYFFVHSLLPESHARVDTPGIAADVRVVRDANGVPGILAEKEEDLAFVLGYVMAQDRLWQMDYMRRAGQGRLAEILGADYLEGDHLMRTINGGRKKEGYYERLGDSERKWLQKFIQGINKYISSHAGKMPVEFSLLEYRPEAFSPDDVNAILLALAWESSVACRIDPLMTRIVGHLGKEIGTELLPTDPAAPSGVFAGYLAGWSVKGVLFSRLTEGRVLGRLPGLRGGCAWAMGPGKTRSGNPMASSTVYQSLAAPDFWYRARLVAGDFHLAGAFIAGIPVALAGTNARTSWGCVSALADDADLFIEALDPDSHRDYWRVDRWRKLEERKETYRVRGGSRVSRTIQFTETGPLVSEIDRDRAISLRWTGRDGTGLFSSFYAINRAQNGKEVAVALKALITPALNVVWCDREGNFGTQSGGRIPVRSSDSDGVLPVPAWTGVHDWSGFIPFDELPSTINPSQEFAISADGRPGGPNYPLLVSCYWNDYARHERIKELLGASNEHFRESFQAIQNDNLSPLGRSLTPAILESMNGKPQKSRLEEEALNTLASWDFQMNEDSAGAAVFGLAYKSLLDELFLKPLGEPLYEGFTSYFALPSRAVKRIFLDNAQGWIKSARPEAILAKAFEKAAEQGKSLMASDPKKWKWGRIHKTEFRHPLTAKSRFLEALYNIGPVSLAGSDDTINLAGWSAVHPFQVVDGVSLRQIADMTEPPQVFGISPLGSSSHFFSAHYKDQTGAWRKGRSYPDPIQSLDIRKNGFNAVLFKSTTGAVSLK
ncbi:MAG: penicillin acylase family protein [Desulfomonile tiedjei]|nr:penicillin acylase family protein [Desulfomonile tiedjei]